MTAATTSEQAIGGKTAAAPLIVLSRAPYDGSFSRGALDVIMSYAVFAQNPAVLFAGEAVLCLSEHQNPTAIERKSLRKVINSLPLYDVEVVYFDEAALVEYGLDAEALPDFARPLSATAIAELRAQAGHILSF